MTQNKEMNIGQSKTSVQSLDVFMQYIVTRIVSGQRVSEMIF